MSGWATVIAAGTSAGRMFTGWCLAASSLKPLAGWYFGLPSRKRLIALDARAAVPLHFSGETARTLHHDGPWPMGRSGVFYVLTPDRGPVLSPAAGLSGRGLWNGLHLCSRPAMGRRGQGEN